MSAAAKARLLGVAMVALGLGLGWFFVLGPLQQAWDGAKQLSYSLRLFVAGPLAIVLGLFLIIGGAPILKALSWPIRGKKQYLILGTMLAVGAAASGFAWWLFNEELQALGFVDGKGQLR